MKKSLSRKNILKEAVVLLIVIAMFFSSVAIANTKTQSQITLTTAGNGSGVGARGPIVWDNGMEYDGLIAAQLDTQYPFEAECADDFHFEEDIEVCDVHWIGGYFGGANYNQVHWPWKITFYNDRGDGAAPGGIYSGPFVFQPSQYTETLIEDTGDSNSGIYYEFSVDLPENIIFFACHKYWISIQGIGFFPPQSGWGEHSGILLHSMVFRFELLGYPDWTDSYDVWGEYRDMCFQLTTKEPCEPSIDVEKYVWDKKNQQWVDADTPNEALDVPICNDVTFKIVIHNNGDTPLTNIIVKDTMHGRLKFISGDPEPDKVHFEEPYWYMEWNFPGPLNPCNTIEIYITAHVEGPECSIDYNYVYVEAQGCGKIVRDEDFAYVHAIKKGKTLNMPIVNFLQSHTNLFRILQKLLKLGL